MAIIKSWDMPDEPLTAEKIRNAVKILKEMQTPDVPYEVREDTLEEFNERMEKEYREELRKKGPILVFAGHHGEFIAWATEQGYNPHEQDEVVYISTHEHLLGRKVYPDRVMWIGTSRIRPDTRQLRTTLVEQIHRTAMRDREERYDF